MHVVGRTHIFGRRYQFLAEIMKGNSVREASLNDHSLSTYLNRGQKALINVQLGSRLLEALHIGASIHPALFANSALLQFHFLPRQVVLPIRAALTAVSPGLLTTAGKEIWNACKLQHVTGAQIVLDKYVPGLQLRCK